MWHAHFTLLEKEPDEAALSRVVDGYQLWRESRTGLHFLTAHAKKLGRRPDFGEYLEWSVQTKLDLGFLEDWVAGQKGALDCHKYQVGYELVQQAGTLSHQLGMGVMTAEDTDEDWGAAAFVKDGALQYLRFKTNRDMGDDADINADYCVHVIFTKAEGFTVIADHEGDMYGVPLNAIADVFRVADIDLVNFAEDKPSREQAKKIVARHGTSVSAYLDSFGVFKRLSHAEPQRSAMDKLRMAVNLVISALLLPFLLTGMFVQAVFFNPRSDDDFSEWKMVLLGVAVLALPLWGVFAILRAIGGAIS